MAAPSARSSRDCVSSSATMRNTSLPSTDSTSCAALATARMVLATERAVAGGLVGDVADDDAADDDAADDNDDDDDDDDVVEAEVEVGFEAASSSASAKSGNADGREGRGVWGVGELVDEEEDVDETEVAGASAGIINCVAELGNVPDEEGDDDEEEEEEGVGRVVVVEAVMLPISWSGAAENVSATSCESGCGDDVDVDVEVDAAAAAAAAVESFREMDISGSIN